MSDPGTSPLFLEADEPGLLLDAVAANHRAFYTAQTDTGGSATDDHDGITYTDGTGSSGPYVLFPALAVDHAGEQIDSIVQVYRRIQPANKVGWWSLDPPVPADLEVLLLARGFVLGWRPCWMWLDLQTLGEQSESLPGVRIEALASSPAFDAPDLPYYDRASGAIIARLAALQPQRTWHFVAWHDDEPVGHSVLHLTTGKLGVAGIYNVGVVPAARHRGIGKAVTRAACLQARALGCHHALLNATGQRMYRHLGFNHIGDGWTWWLDVAHTESHPPTPERIALAEAVGRGDILSLTNLVRGNQAQLNEPLTSGRTLLELAAHLNQHAAAAFLVSAGANIEILPAWDLGWKEQVVELLATHPERANDRRGHEGVTPLHEAVRRDDLMLVQVLLAAHPDLTIKDALYNATAFDWARHLERQTIAQCISQHLTTATDSNDG